MDRIYPPRKNRPNPVVALTSDPVWPQHDWEDWFDIKAVHSLGLISCSKGLILTPSRPLLDVPIETVRGE
jgi:hypothetical protein